MSAGSAARKKSTTVRLQLARVALTRRAFGVLERLAPWPASRWALDLWCTLPGNAGRRRDARPGPGNRSWVESDGHRIAVETWGSDGPAAYLMHGWGGWRGQLGALVAPLVEAGYRVIAFDVPGHGDSEPGSLGRGRGNGMEFARALTDVAAVHGRPAVVIGHSFGCATAVLAIRDGLQVDRLVLIAPAVDPTTYLKAVGAVFGFGPRVFAGLHTRIERLARRPLSDFDPTTVEDPSAMPPTLLIHDRRDKEIPYAEGERLAAAWPDAELISTEGLGHQRILADPTVIARAVDFATALRAG
ncbi:alpha/beta fold hydrolase [Microlunatus soli]|uniref:Lysophospholipase, alpha-beta hydrolase superfamily n=1 Tax=Microlunatus soli TaxID=630515 RepID=A0A1H1ZKP1_9ACTN|nr:alpha/beta hydrolase [Microlunatus soli]SDT34391.1 Lysophospholipase, alpha-beta hydrolase superfamily [Microlunatus soli]